MPIEFSELLNKIRTQESLTQAELASMIDCSTISIHYYESNKRNPSASLIRRLSDKFPQHQDLIGSFLKIKEEGVKITEQDNNMESRVVSQLLDTIDETKVKVETLKMAASSRDFQNAVNESMGVDTWVYQAELKREGLTFKRRITEIGNGMDIFTRILGYSDDEAKSLLNTEWINAMSQDDKRHPINTIMHSNSIEHIRRIFLKLPTLYLDIKEGVFNVDLPFIFIHKQGHSVASNAHFNFNLSTSIITSTTYFFNKSSEE